MAKPIRVKTQWFKDEGEARSPEEVANAIASVIWRLADNTIDSLSQADYDIITPQRGFRIIGELACFLTHYADRLVFGRVDDAARTQLIIAIVRKLAEVMEANIIEITGRKDPDYDYRAGFIDLFNRRSADYATFDIHAEQISYQASRYLSLMVREIMEAHDQTWVQDQLIEIEVPQIMATCKKTIDGFYPAAA
jgi:hypothetical protein